MEASLEAMTKDLGKRAGRRTGCGRKATGGDDLANPLAICVLILLSLVSTESRSDTLDEQSNYRMGLALAMPTIGLSIQSVLSERLTVSAVAGYGFQAQLNFTGRSSDGSYFLLGAGRDDIIGLIRVGYGYVWELPRWSFHLEASLNIPVWDRELGGLADVVKVVYLFPIGAGVHYRF